MIRHICFYDLNSLVIMLTSDIIPNTQIHMLIDSGSTHCFMDLLQLSGQPSSAVEVAQSHRLTEGKTRVWIINLNTMKGDLTWQRENQREKSKVSPLPVSQYYITLNCAQGHYSVCTDPALCRPLTDSGCMYVSYFTSTVTLEVTVEWSSNLRAEWSSEVWVEQSSDLEVGWNLGQRKCEMGHPLTLPVFIPEQEAEESDISDMECWFQPGESQVSGNPSPPFPCQRNCVPCSCHVYPSPLCLFLFPYGFWSSPCDRFKHSPGVYV